MAEHEKENGLLTIVPGSGAPTALFGASAPVALAAGEEELLRALHGKRAGSREPLATPVVLFGRADKYRGTTVDVSRSGMLVRSDNVSLGLWNNEDLCGAADRVFEAFANGAQVEFRRSGILVRGKVARLVALPAEDGGGLALALQFQRPLSQANCETLGISTTRE